MPELPEVEVVRLRLRSVVVNRRIAEIQTARANYAFLTAPARLRSKLQGRRIMEIERQGKYLLFLLDDHSRLLVHLGMTGQLFPPLQQAIACGPRSHAGSSFRTR